MKINTEIIDFSTIDDRDWHRLAAYIDGEGTIVIAVVKAKHWAREHLYVTVDVASTDERLTLFLARRFGGSWYKNAKQRDEWSAATHWNIACRQAVELLTYCLPHFIIKREQAMVAIAFQKTLRRWGRGGAPAHVIGEQYRLRAHLSALKGTSARQKRNRRQNRPTQ